MGLLIAVLFLHNMPPAYMPPAPDGNRTGYKVRDDHRVIESIDQSSPKDLQTLLQAKVNTEVINAYGETALILAARSNKTDFVKLLLDRGADIEATDDYEQTALSAASGEGHLQVVQLLSSRGARINSVDEYNSTALMFAAKNGHVDVADFLVKAGARVNAIDDYCKTAFLYAQERKLTAITGLLQQQGATAHVPQTCTPQPEETPVVLELFFKRPVKRHIKKFLKTSKVKLHCEMVEDQLRTYVFTDRKQLRDELGLSFQTTVLPGAGNRVEADASVSQISNPKKMRKKYLRLVRSLSIVDDPKFEITDHSSPKACRQYLTTGLAPRVKH